MAEDLEISDELKRIKRVSDMLASAHAQLRDRYSRSAVALDVAILAASTWIVGLVFVDPKIGVRLTPPGIESQIWIGMLSITTFFLSVIQLRVDWKGRSDAHKRSFDIYAQVKRECGYLLAGERPINRESCGRVLARYDLAAEVGVPIAESEFLRRKAYHLRKVEISKCLDQAPNMSILLFRVRMWWRDNRSVLQGKI